MTDRRKALEQGARRLNRAARDELENPDREWFVVFAMSGQEFTAQKVLRHWGGKAYLPLCFKWRRMNRYQREKQRIAYPAIAGSLFVGFPSVAVPWFEIFKKLPSVYGVLGVDGKPVSIPGKRIVSFIHDNQFRLDAAAEQRHMRTYHEFGVGDQVCIVEGPFAGHVSKVDRITGSKAHMLMKLLGGLHDVVVPLDFLEKVA